MASLSRRLKTFTLVGLVGLSTFVALEVAYRIFLFGFDSLSFRLMNSIHPIGLSGMVQPSPYPDVVLELKPNLKAYFKKSRFITNSQGLRDKEYALEKPPNTFRVAVIGDSFTMPAGVDIEDAYHSLLEERLNQASPDRTYEFVNFAVGGYELRQYLGVMQYKALDYDPDLFLIGFFKNDFKTRGEQIFQEPYRVKPRSHPFFRLYTVKKFREVLLTRILGRELEDDELIEVGDLDFNYARDLLAKIGAFGRREEIPILLAYIDLKPAPEPIREFLEQETHANGLEFIDVSASFPTGPLSQYVIYRGDPHPNHRAHTIFADILYPKVQSML